MSSSGIKNFLRAGAVFFFIFALGSGVYLSRQSQKTASKAAEINTSSTNKLVSALDNYNKTPRFRQRVLISNLRTLALKRKLDLQAKIKSDPKGFLQEATLYSQRNKFPAEIQPLIEEQKELTGKITVWHIDDFEKGKGEYKYELSVNTKKYNLYFAGSEPYLLTDSTVKVKAIGVSPDFVLNSSSPISQSSVTSTTGINVINDPQVSVTGEQKTLVILINFKDHQVEPISKAEAQDLFFKDVQYPDFSINSFYKENSFNKTWFNGEVKGYYTLDVDSSCEGGGNNSEKVRSWAALAKNMVQAENVDLSLFGRIVFISSPECSKARFHGQAAIGGKESDIVVVPDADDFDNKLKFIKRKVIAHELGHSLGRPHANALVCRSQNIDGFCADFEYGDPSDIMGGGGFSGVGHFNAYSKGKLGWLQNENVQTITQNGTYSLASLQKNSTNPQLIKIYHAIPNNLDDYYYISYRPRIGYDNDIDEAISLNGISIHARNSLNLTSLLLDSHPSLPVIDFHFEDANLEDGQEFNDQLTGVSIKQLSHSPDNATIQITFNRSIDAKSIIGSWKTVGKIPAVGTPPMSPTLQQAKLFVAKNSLFSLGRNAYWDYPGVQKNPPIHLAKILTDGSLSEFKQVGTTPILENLSTAFASIKDVSIYQDNRIYVLLSGGNSATLDRFKLLTSWIDNNGEISNWSELQLPELSRNEGVSSIKSINIYNGFIYVFIDTSRFVSPTRPDLHYVNYRYAKIKGDGGLSEWSSQQTLSQPLGRCNNVINYKDSFLFYCLNQNHNLKPTNLYSIKVSNDGPLSSEIHDFTSSLLAIDLVNGSVLIHKDNFILFGGASIVAFFSGGVEIPSLQTGFPKALVLSAAIRDDQGLDTFSLNTPLPKALHYIDAAAFKDFIYIGGGSDGIASDCCDTVYMAKINGSSISPIPTPTLANIRRCIGFICNFPSGIPTQIPPPNTMPCGHSGYPPCPTPRPGHSPEISTTKFDDLYPFDDYIDEIVATDDRGHPMTVEVTGLPPGLTFNPASCKQTGGTITCSITGRRAIGSPRKTYYPIVYVKDNVTTSITKNIPLTVR